MSEDNRTTIGPDKKKKDKKIPPSTAYYHKHGGYSLWQRYNKPRECECGATVGKLNWYNHRRSLKCQRIRENNAKIAALENELAQLKEKEKQK